MLEKKLEPFKAKEKEEILKDPYMQDIIERNLEVSAQAAIDIANRIISIEGFEKPRDYYEAILRLGEAEEKLMSELKRCLSRKLMTKVAFLIEGGLFESR